MAPSFEQYAAQRLVQDRERIIGDWVERLSTQLDVEPGRVLPHQDLLDDVPVVLQKAADFLVVPDRETIAAERLVTDKMRSIAHLRRHQGWGTAEVVREFDELAQILDAAALEWIDDFPAAPDAKSVGRVFGRLNRIPLLMGQIVVGALEDERNDLLRQLAEAEEEERTRLSRELHDGLGQLLTVLLLGLKSLDRGDGDQAAQIEELERLADRMAREAQQLALNLRPPALDNLGLPLALESLANEWTTRTGVPSDVQVVGDTDPRLPPEIESSLYRVAQEALNNVLKHAAASSVSLILERREQFLRLIVEDDGCGFAAEGEPTSPETQRRLGVRGMRERVARLGGTLEIESSAGHGTTLFVRVPVAANGSPA